MTRKLSVPKGFTYVCSSASRHNVHCCKHELTWRREKRLSDQVGGVLCFLGPFVRKLVIRSSTSEGLLLKLDRLLPEVEKAAAEEEKHNAEDGEEKHSQESAST